MRIDRWLWAARFYKTRALAQEAVSGGRVQANGSRVKPARAVRVGDHLSITRGEDRIDIAVCNLATRRGPATAAALLYEETADSIARREQRREERRLASASRRDRPGRPDKQARRKIIRFTRKRGD